MTDTAIEFVAFENRADRSRYVASRFATLITGDLLDVGCWERDLEREIQPGSISSYVGVDVGGDPTLAIDLEATPRLPFQDASFDTIVCTDVLEHLGNLHAVLAEMVRLAKPGGHIILSLPNCWRALRNRIRRGHGTPRFYGLPATPPDDRHKWFFNVEDAACFYAEQTGIHPLELIHTHVQEKPRNSVDRAIRRLGCRSQKAYLNLHADTVWAVYRRQ